MSLLPRYSRGQFGLTRLEVHSADRLATLAQSIVSWQYGAPPKGRARAK